MADQPLAPAETGGQKQCVARGRKLQHRAKVSLKALRHQRSRFGH
jgi:hypothetical protein